MNTIETQFFENQPTHSQIKEHEVEVQENEVEVEENEVELRASVFRFKFTDEVVSCITNFAKVHQYDIRENYKEAWSEWVDENDEMIYQEKRRLENLGYNGDVEEKMYKAGRYYFRKKTTQLEPTKSARRKYISSSRELIDAMDSHILENIQNENFTPAESFDNFCENSRTILLDEIKNTMQKVNLSKDEMTHKIKKTYKNRYFIVSRKMTQRKH